MIKNSHSLMKNTILAYKQSVKHFMKSLMKVAPVLSCALTPEYSLAEGHTTIGAHIHGLSEMSIAIEKQRLVIELVSPAIDFVGFEHRAKTEENIELVNKLEKQLSKHDQVFSFTGGNCQLISKHIDLSNLKNTLDNHKHHNEEKINNHGEVIANYDYHCEKASELSLITVKVFNLFPSVKEIQAMWITEVHQGAELLNAKNEVINLR